MFCADEYLAHIGFIQRKSESLKEQLIRLHRCHSLAVPFEDFNSFCGLPVPLDTENVFKKIVRDHRGGYCFELNLLFQKLLISFGYEAKSILCRPFSGEGALLPLTHRLIIVPLDGELWIADVGLGGNGWIEPLLLKKDIVQQQFGRTYRIIEDPDMGYIVQLKKEDKFVMAVSFTLSYAEESDFEMSNYYTSSYPSSPFVRRMMCTLPTYDGRYTIRDELFKVEHNGHTTVTTLTPGTFPNILNHYFGLKLEPEMYEYIAKYLTHSSKMS